MSDQKPHVLSATAGNNGIAWQIECPYDSDDNDRPCRTFWPAECEEGEADEFGECSHGGTYGGMLGHAHPGPECYVQESMCYVQESISEGGLEDGVRWMPAKVELALPMAVTVEDCDEECVVLAPFDAAAVSP